MNLTAWLELDQIERVAVKDRMVVGRHSTCDLVLPYPKLSRQHAMLFKDAQHYWVTDLNSRNGTWVRHRRIHQPVRLRSGDTILLDDYPVVFYQRSPSQADLERKLASLEAAKATVCSDAYVTVAVGRVAVGFGLVVEHQDTAAERLITDYFGIQPDSQSGLPPDIGKWLRGGQSERHPLCVRLNRSRLVVTHVVIGERAQLILTEEVHYMSSKALNSLGLSLDEQRVMKMMAEERPAEEICYALSIPQQRLPELLRELAHKVKAPSIDKLIPSLMLTLGVEGQADRPTAFNVESPLAAHRPEAPPPAPTSERSTPPASNRLSLRELFAIR